MYLIGSKNTKHNYILFSFSTDPCLSPNLLSNLITVTCRFPVYCLDSILTLEILKVFMCLSRCNSQNAVEQRNNITELNTFIGPPYIMSLLTWALTVSFPRWLVIVVVNKTPYLPTWKLKTFYKCEDENTN